MSMVTYIIGTNAETQKQVKLKIATTEDGAATNDIIFDSLTGSTEEWDDETIIDDGNITARELVETIANIQKITTLDLSGKQIQFVNTRTFNLSHLGTDIQFTPATAVDVTVTGFEGESMNATTTTPRWRFKELHNNGSTTTKSIAYGGDVSSTVNAEVAAAIQAAWSEIYFLTNNSGGQVPDRNLVEVNLSGTWNSEDESQ